jgi:hypothetical protein
VHLRFLDARAKPPTFRIVPHRLKLRGTSLLLGSVLRLCSCLIIALVLRHLQTGMYRDKKCVK